MIKLFKILCFYIVIFVITGSCGRGPHETIEAIVQSFNEFYGKNYTCPVELVEVIYPDQPDIAGRAIGSPCKIQIQRKYWETISFDQRELLLYHELGHIYGASHDNTTHPNDSSRPLSIMNYQLFLKYKFYRNEYKEELRHRLNNNP